MVDEPSVVTADAEASWRAAVHALFLSSDPIPAFDHSPGRDLLRAVGRPDAGSPEEVGASVTQLLQEVLNYADVTLGSQGAANREAVRGALALRVPDENELPRLTTANGIVARWPSLSARHAWAYALARSAIGGSPNGSSKSGKRYWTRYETALAEAFALFLASRVEPSDSDWKKCRIRQTIKSINGAVKRYVLRTEFQFVTHMQPVRFAEIDDEEVMDWLCVAYPQIFDVFNPAESGLVTFSLRVRELRGRWRGVKLVADEALVEQITGERPKLQSHNLVVWRSSDLELSGEYELSLICDFELPMSDPYFYWSAPRKLWLESLTADVSAILPYAPGAIGFYPRLGVESNFHIDHAAGVLDVEVNAWLDAGKSIEVRWDVT